MNSKLLNSYKEFVIEKSWEELANGAIDKQTVVYTAYDKEGGLYAAKNKLTDLKKEIDIYTA